MHTCIRNHGYTVMCSQQFVELGSGTPNQTYMDTP